MSVQIVNYQNKDDVQRTGFAAISLDSLVSTGAITIKAGSAVEVAGALYEFQADETESGGTWAGIGASNVVYVYIVPAGSSATFIYSTTAPTFDLAKQSWYTGGTSRCVAFLYKDSGGLYQAKNILPASQAWSLPVNYPYTNAAPDPYLGRLHHLPLGNTTSRQIGAALTPAALGSWYGSAIQGSGLVGIPAGAKGILIKIIVYLYVPAIGWALLKLAFSDNNSNAPSASTAHPVAPACCYAASTGGIGLLSPDAYVDVPLNASGQFYMYTLNAFNLTLASCSVTIIGAGYYMGD